MSKHPHYSDVNRPPPVLVNFLGDPGRTRQSEKDACDINRIMARYEKSGVVPQVQAQYLFMDVSDFGDFRTVMENVARAQEVFMAQPAELRERFDNDPARFLDWTSDPNNRAEMIELGLLPRDAAPGVVEGAVVDEPEGVGPDSPPGG